MQKVYFRAGGCNKNSQEIKNNHICGNKLCSFCKQYYKPDNLHLCKLNQKANVIERPKLNFLSFEFLSNNSANCSECYLLKNNYRLKEHLSWSDLHKSTIYQTLHCPEHSNETLFNDLVCITLFYEINPNSFKKIQFVHFDEIRIENPSNVYNYEHDIREISPKNPLKLSEDMKLKRNEITSESIKDCFMKYFLSDDFHGSTFIVQDENGNIMVILLHFFDISFTFFFNRKNSELYF